jgi:hypothetical protein
VNTAAGSERIKSFTTEEFCQMLLEFCRRCRILARSGAIAAPERSTGSHALGVLRSSPDDPLRIVRGSLFPSQHAECLEYCGNKPIGVRLYLLGATAFREFSGETYQLVTLPF